MDLFVIKLLEKNSIVWKGVGKLATIPTDWELKWVKGNIFHILRQGIQILFHIWERECKINDNIWSNDISMRLL